MTSHSGRPTRSLYTTEARKGSTLCSLPFAGSILMMVGFFGPWVAHRTTAMTVTGYELSEFAKFFPQVQSGSVPVRRALFTMPLLASAISMSLIINHSTRGPLWRLPATVLVAVIATSTLPPFQAILDPQYHLQLILVSACILLTVGTILTRRLSERSRSALLAVLATAGAASAAWQARLLYPLVRTVYGAAIWPGWGMWACATGSLLLFFTGVRKALRP